MEFNSNIVAREVEGYLLHNHKDVYDMATKALKGNKDVASDIDSIEEYVKAVFTISNAEENTNQAIALFVANSVILKYRN